MSLFLHELLSELLAGCTALLWFGGFSGFARGVTMEGKVLAASILCSLHAHPVSAVCWCSADSQGSQNLTGALSRAFCMRGKASLEMPWLSNLLD